MEASNSQVLRAQGSPRPVCVAFETMAGWGPVEHGFSRPGHRTVHSLEFLL
jgi:hypothetical protein